VEDVLSPDIDTEIATLLALKESAQNALFAFDDSLDEDNKTLASGMVTDRYARNCIVMRRLLACP
jgi:hypothetical protein